MEDTQEKVSNKFMPWIVVFWGTLFFFYQFGQMNIISSLAPYLMKSFSINATHLGMLESAYFFGTILFLLPAGQILDRFSTRKVILSVLIISITGTFCFAISQSYEAACISRFITGIGDAFCVLGSIRIASRWFSNERLALVSGLIFMIGMMGGMVAQTPFALLIEHLNNWHLAVIVDGIVGFVIWILIFIGIKDYPREENQKQRNIQKELKEIGYWKAMRSSYGRLCNWLCGFYTCLISLPIFLMGGGGFGSLYLQQVKLMTPLQASYPPMMLFFGVAAGSPITGWVSDILRRRRLPMQLAAVISISLILSIVYLSESIGIYIFLFFLLGFIISTATISYPLVTESNPRIFTASSISVISFVSLSGGAVIPPLFGYVMDKSKNFKIVHNIHVYSAMDYHKAMLIMPLATLSAFVITFFIRETFCKNS